MSMTIFSSIFIYRIGFNFICIFAKLISNIPLPAFLHFSFIPNDFITLFFNSVDSIGIFLLNLFHLFPKHVFKFY